MSTARSSLLGRQAWRSLYESLDILSARISSRPNSANRVGLGHSNTIFGRPSNCSSWSFPKAPRVYGYNVRRSFTSGGLLLVGVNPTSSTTSAVMSSCTSAADSAINRNATHKSELLGLARQSWRRDIHTGRGRRRTGAVSRRRKSTKSTIETGKAAAASQTAKGESGKPSATPQAESKPEADAGQHNYISNYFHLPNMHLPHRPTKEEFLAAANGFWARLKVRFKWYSIRSMRPWNTDEWGAFLSFFLFGHLVWILVGTTTFVSGLLLFVNTVSAQGMMSRNCNAISANNPQNGSPRKSVITSPSPLA